MNTATEYAWLIERRVYNSSDATCEYGYIRYGKVEWTSNSHAALRLSRKQDAESLIDDFELHGAYASEHGWD